MNSVDKTAVAQANDAQISEETIKEWLKKDIESVIVLMHVVRNDDNCLNVLAQHFIKRYKTDNPQDNQMDMFKD